MRRLRMCVCLFGLLAIGGVAHATVVVPADLKTLAGRAQAIVHGRVIDVRSQWAETGNRIETLVTVEASDYLKGNLGGRVVFRVPGGKVGYLRAVTVGAPVIREGDEIVVFLQATGPAMPHVAGFNQGVFRVSVDAISGRRVVSSPLLAGPTRGTQTPARGAAARRPVPLTDFEQRVRTIVEQQEAPGVARPRGVAAGRGRR